ncbi:MAG: ATP-binding protein [Chloroflexota bacterium]
MASLRQRFRDFPIGRKLNSGFGLLVFLTSIVVSLILFASQQATTKIDRTVDIHAPTTLASARAQASLLQMQAAVRGYLAVGDLRSIDDYNKAKALFQQNLTELKRLSGQWSNQADIERLNELINIFAIWLPMPEQLFELYDNPLKNQPALQLASEEIAPLTTRLLDEIELFIDDISVDMPENTSDNIIWRNEMIDFRTTVQAMSTNLRAYASTGDLVFKFGYADHLGNNSQLWAQRTESVTDLSSEQQAAFAQIGQTRAEFLRLPAHLFHMVEGEHSNEAQYLFQYEVEPRSQRMLHLLEELTTGQQALLQSELDDGKQSLANVRYQTAISGFLALMLGIGMAYIFRENIASPIRRLNNTVQQISAGQLQAQADIESGDEIGRLATAFNHMTGQLRRTIGELATAKETAETASRAKSDFLASMSHELRTPLNAIVGYTQILTKAPDLSAGQQSALKMIQASSGHLLTLITDILDISKIEARKLELHPVPIELDPFLGNIVEMFRVRAQQKTGITFVYQPATSMPATIYADEKRLRQIMLNLLSNAVKFTDTGSVTLGIEAKKIRAEKRLQQPQNTQLTIEVVDTGIGISPEDLSKIFLPFEQVGIKQYQTEGTGLGLAISKRLVDAMDGVIHVESMLGQGSTFSVTLCLSANWEEVISPNPTQYIPVSLPKHTPMVLPSQAELTILLDLAMKGELLTLKQQVQALGETNPVYRPFVVRVTTLVDDFDEAKIEQLLRQAMA